MSGTSIFAQPFRSLTRTMTVILLPASFTHNFVSGVQSLYFSESQDAMVLQTCNEKQCSALVSLQLDSLIWETAIHMIHKPKIVNESLQ